MKLGQDKAQNTADTKPRRKYNVLLAAGLGSIIIGLVLLFISFARFTAYSVFIRSALVLVIGCLILYRALTFTKRAWAIFLGMYLTFFGTVMLFIDSGVTYLDMEQLWPTGVILCGLTLIPSGMYKYKRYHPAYAVPSAVLVLMGIFFLLFSLDIIQESFLRVVARWWPVLLIAAGCAMIIIFVYIQHNRAFLFKNGTDDDDEDVG